MSGDFCIKCDKELCAYCGCCMDSASWRAKVLDVERERDEARAEVKRMRDELRTVAERQREACAEACEKVLEEADRHALISGLFKTGIGAAVECVDAARATPLVTDA